MGARSSRKSRADNGLAGYEHANDAEPVRPDLDVLAIPGREGFDSAAASSLDGSAQPRGSFQPCQPCPAR